MQRIAYLRRMALAWLLVLLVYGGASPCVADDVANASWVRQGRITPQARELLDAMRAAETFGLAPEDFAADLARIDGPRNGADYAALDALVSRAASRFVRQLHDGRVDPRSAGYELRRRRASLDTDAALRRLASAVDVQAGLADLEPASAQYRALKQALARYRQIPPGLADLPRLPGRSMVAGDPYSGCGQLRQLLAQFGDAPPATTPGCDADLVPALERFQRRHGLRVDGVIGPRTFAALTVPIAHRVRQIELTMERWRWLPDFTPPAVIVNVPQYMLYALQKPGAADSTYPSRIPVIVGESARQTPIFDSVIESVIVRPYWNVPSSIVREELLASISRDPGYLARHELEIVRGEGDDALVLPADAAAIAALRAGSARLRQRPGPGNALGLIKFVLPNRHSVYLHSTPEAQLFARERRALSHGCIRVSDAVGLAAYLLQDTEGNWDASAIEAATCGTETFTVRLARPVPIFILYGTVVIDTSGEVLFFDDVYGYDRKLDGLLRRPHEKRITEEKHHD